MKEYRSNEGGEIMSMESGTRVGLYCLGAAIGKGNFSVVRVATHVPTGMRVAVKILHKTKMSLETLEKTYREVQIMKQLHHRNIVQLYQVIESTNWMFIFMEFVARGELFDYLSKSGRLTENDARRKFKQILDAVEYCHTMNIVHRDLKAENLLMDENFDIKLVDFGFGSFYNKSYLLSTWCGSPPYAAPELFRGEPYIGPKADIWSLGVVLYVMVCGALPFNEPCSIVKLREQVLNSLVRFPYFLSYECEHLIRLILNRDPSKRPSIPSIKDHKWMKNSLDESAMFIDTYSQNEQSREPSVVQGRSSRRCNTVGDDSGFEEPVDFTKYNLDKFRLSISHDYMDRDINEDVLQIMERCGFARTSIIKELSLNIYGSLTATYLLLCEKLRLSRRVHNNSISNNIQTKCASIQQNITPNKEYKLTNPTIHICEIDSSLKMMKVCDSITGRRSPYDNIKGIESKTQTIISQTKIENKSKPLSHLLENTHDDVDIQYINSHNVASVVIDLVIPHNDRMSLYSEAHNNFPRSVNSPPEMTLYNNGPSHDEKSRSSLMSSNTYSKEIENVKSSIKSVSPTCFILNQNSSLPQSPIKYIPTPNKKVFNGQIVSVGRNNILQTHSNDLFHNKSNILTSQNASYGHSSPLNSTLNNDPCLISKPQIINLFEVPVSNHLYQQQEFNRHMFIPQHLNREQNYDLLFDCESQDSYNTMKQKDFSDLPNNTAHYPCNSVSGDNEYSCNDHHASISPISNHMQMTIKPSLSTIRKSLSSYPETSFDMIPAYNISRVSHLSSVNTNIIRLS